MSFRRIPFQFTSTDPAERQRELEKRFGFPTRNKMYVENSSPLSMGSGFRDPNASSSPRLQHRVPIFGEGYDQPIRSSVDSANSVPESKKPNVRVIPIKIEGAETLPSTRHRTLSGPAGMVKESNGDLLPQKDDASPLKRSMQDLTKPSKMKTTTGPKVYNIPIKVEGGSTVGKKSKSEMVKSSVTKGHSKSNECDVPKAEQKVKPSSNEQKAEQEIGEEQRIEMNISNSLKKIESILEELKSYESGVQEFSGTGKDKQYLYLDEMLTRCMLRLDDIDTMGSEKVRSARKNAVKKVQACIDLLENKINAVSENARASVPDNEAKDISNEVDTDVMGNEVTTEISRQDTAITNVSEREAVATEIPEQEVVVTEVSEHEVASNDDSEQVIVTEVPDHIEIAEVNDVEMVEISNAEPENTIVESIAVIKPVSPEEVPVNPVSETKALNELEAGKVTVDEPREVAEVEMVETSSSQGINTESQLEVEMPECPSALCVQVSSDKEISEENANNFSETKISQDGDVEMKEIQNTVKEKAVNCDSVKLQNIPSEETSMAVAGSEITPTGQFVSQSDCLVSTASSHSDNDIKESAH